MSKNHFAAVVVTVLAAAGAAVLGGCTSEGHSQSTFRVVATTGLVGDLARRIAGPHAEVESLMGPGVDPHLYKASEGDVRRLGNASLIIYSGLMLEGRMGDVLERLAQRRPVLAAAEALPADLLLHPAGARGHPDPHVWFDPSLWKHAARAIAEKLSELLPAHAGEFRRRGAELERELDALDEESRALLATIPPARRVLVTAHDAFSYFGRRYSVEVVGLQGVSTASEASIQDVQRIADLLVAREVKAIFFESSVPERYVRAVVEACSERGHPVRVGGELFSDALGPQGTPAGEYPGMFRHNVRTIVEALR